MSSAPQEKKLATVFDYEESDPRGLDPFLDESPLNKVAFQDPDFLLRKELRPVRLQLELLKPELTLQEQAIKSTVVVFGSARISSPEVAAEKLAAASEAIANNGGDPQAARALKAAEKTVEQSRYYTEARKLGNLISTNTDKDRFVVVTGGGPGIMEAANRGAHDQGAQSIGMNIVLPFEEAPNPYITPGLSFQFHYFAIRKMHLLMRAKCLVAFPGGFGTLDELFEALTLIQTGKINPIPILLFGRKFWESVVNFQALVDEGTISAKDLDLFNFVETAEEAWKNISSSNGLS